MFENRVFPATDFDGALDWCLDSYSLATPLTNGDIGFVVREEGAYFFYFDGGAEDAQDVPKIIRPYDYVNGGVWKLVDFAPGEFEVHSHGSTHTPGESDAIPFATLEDSGLMSSTDKKLLAEPFGYKNKIINGDFKIWQRGVGASSGTGYVTADRWFIDTDGSTVVSCARANLVHGLIPKSENKHVMCITTTAGSGDAAYGVVGQKIESVRTLAGQFAALSFWVKSDATKYVGVGLQQFFGTGGSPSSTNNIKPTSNVIEVTTTWTKFTWFFFLDYIVDDTLGTNGDDYLGLLFYTSAGADHETGSFELNMGNQSSVIYVANVQLEGGITCTEFEKRPVALEELMCHRYYWRKNPGLLSCNGYAADAKSSWVFGPSVSMRIDPVAEEVLSNVALTRCNTPVWTAVNNGGLLTITTDQATVNGYVTFGGNDYIALDAEL